MRPPIFDAVDASTAVKALLGDPPRFYGFGQAPATPAKPYAVWQSVYGTPDNLINQAPVSDRWGVQVDVYAVKDTAARDVAKALRDALEGVCHIVRWGGESRELDTGLYRYSFDVEFLTAR